MRAIVTNDYGAAPVLEEVPDVEAEPGKILIRVNASSLNGFDIAVAAGKLEGVMKYHFPVVLGRDVAGIVEEGGEHFTTGDAVFGNVTGGLGPNGGFAELVTLPEAKGLARIPAGLEMHEAGALGVTGIAATASVDALDPSAGESVLVAGATGGVGSLVVQLLAARGVRVLATSKPGAGTDFVRDLGATDAVDYTADLAEQVRALAPDGVDGAIHLAGDGMAVADLVRDGGRFASTLGLGQDAFEGRDIAATAISAPATEEALGALAQQVVDGSLRLAITKTYPLEDVPRAFQEFTGTLGKAAVTVA